MTHMKPKVAIVYLSYNCAKYIGEVFDSVKAQDYPADRLEVIAVDNASSDESDALLREIDGITYLPSGENLGYAEGNNLAIRHALLNGADYVYLLNGDAKLDASAITEAVKMAESDVSIGAVQSRVMLWQDPERCNVTGGMVHWLGFGYARDNGALWSGQVADGEDVTFASGAAVLYRASVLREVGLLEPFFFMYHDDLELGWRIRLAGYRNVIATNSVAFHDYEFRRSVKKFFWMERNRWLVHLSFLSTRTIVLLLPWLLVTEIGLILFAIRGGWIKEKLLVYRALLSSDCRSFVRRKRAEVQALRSVSDRSIVAFWTAVIAHQETDSAIVRLVINPATTFVWRVLVRPFVV